MAHTVFCVRNKKEMEGLDEPPFDSEFGQKIYKNVSKAAWAEWVDRQKMLLNEYRLQPWTPQAQQFLVEQMEEFFFGDGSALPTEYVPPTHYGSCASGRLVVAIGSEFPASGTGPACWCKLSKTPKPAHPSRLDCVGTWLSLVEHSLGVRGVGSSNLPVPTIIRIIDLEGLPSRGKL